MTVNSYVNAFENMFGPKNFKKLEALADFDFRAKDLHLDLDAFKTPYCRTS